MTTAPNPNDTALSPAGRPPATGRELAAPTIEDTVSDLLAAAYSAAIGKQPTPAWLAGLETRYGLRGEPATLDAAGKIVGVTRERVRQVCARIEPLLLAASVPELQPALEVLAAQAPVAEPIGAVLAPLGLSRPDLSGKTLLRVLALVGESALDLVGTDLEVKAGWLVDTLESHVTAAVRVAHRHTSSYGMTTVEDVRQGLSTETHPVNAREVEVILRADPRVLWAGDWLWVDKPLTSEHHNAMVNTFRQVLSVISPQTVASLHDGLCRNQKFRNRDIIPPVAAVTEFLSQSSQFRVEGDLVEHLAPLDHHQVHGGVAATMIDVLLASTYRVMDRGSLMQAWEDAGVSPGTAGVFATYAEWMESPAPRVWGLRGANPSAAVVSELQADARTRRESEPHQASWTWTADGTIKVTVDVSTSARQSGTVILASLGQTIGQQRLKFLVGDEPAGELKVSSEHLWTWGWGPAFRAAGAKVGQVMQVELDLAAGSATVTLGGRELWRP